MIRIGVGLFPLSFVRLTRWSSLGGQSASQDVGSVCHALPKFIDGSQEGDGRGREFRVLRTLLEGQLKILCCFGRVCEFLKKRAETFVSEGVDPLLVRFDQTSDGFSDSLQFNGAGFEVVSRCGEQTDVQDSECGRSLVIERGAPRLSDGRELDETCEFLSEIVDLSTC